MELNHYEDLLNCYPPVKRSYKIKAKIIYKPKTGMLSNKTQTWVDLKPILDKGQMTSSINIDHFWEYQADNIRTCKNCYLCEYYDEDQDDWIWLTDKEFCIEAFMECKKNCPPL